MHRDRRALSAPLCRDPHDPAQSVSAVHTSALVRRVAGDLSRAGWTLEAVSTDNGSEFAKEFKFAAAELSLSQYFSRPKTPTDNPFDERFNRTLHDEFIALGNMTTDCAVFNRKLTDWLIEYNFKRPHQSLAYEVPVEYHYQHQKVSTMYPSSTHY